MRPKMVSAVLLFIFETEYNIGYTVFMYATARFSALVLLAAIAIVWNIYAMMASLGSLLFR